MTGQELPATECAIEVEGTMEQAQEFRRQLGMLRVPKSPVRVMPWVGTSVAQGKETGAVPGISRYMVVVRISSEVPSSAMEILCRNLATDAGLTVVSVRVTGS
jgi:hypothetical protein